MFNQRFEYRVCQTELNRVTFVNGTWNGSLPPNHPKGLESCPWTWDFLNLMGQEGWQLLQAIMFAEERNAQLLYLARLMR